ncbi:MAG: hypothetical protein P4L16_00175 [Chlamydiales bacterium]|nr:hypothetical protein [Chlamydiales bacterium]
MVVSYTGMVTSSAEMSIPSSVHPSKTASAPSSLRASMIRISSSLDSENTFP